MKGYWTEFVIGIIMIASPWALGFSDISLAKWCNVLVGLLLVIASSWMIFGTPSALMSSVAEEPHKAKRKTKNSVEQK